VRIRCIRDPGRTGLEQFKLQAGFVEGYSKVILTTLVDNVYFVAKGSFLMLMLMYGRSATS